MSSRYSLNFIDCRIVFTSILRKKTTCTLTGYCPAVMNAFFAILIYRNELKTLLCVVDNNYAYLFYMPKRRSDQFPFFNDHTQTRPGTELSILYSIGALCRRHHRSGTRQREVLFDPLQRKRCTVY
jgi:hypothetical protein